MHQVRLGHHKLNMRPPKFSRGNEEHFKNLPLGMKSDVYRLKPDPRAPETTEERLIRETGKLYHTNPEVKAAVDDCQERCKALIKEIEEEGDGDETEEQTKKI